MPFSPRLSQRLGYSQQVLLRRVSLSLVLALAIVADRGCGDAAVLKPPRVVSSADFYDRNEGPGGLLGCPHNFRIFWIMVTPLFETQIHSASLTYFILLFGKQCGCQSASKLGRAVCGRIDIGRTSILIWGNLFKSPRPAMQHFVCLFICL